MDPFPEPNIALKRLRVAAAFIDFMIYSIIAFVIGFFSGETFSGESGSGYSIGFTLTGLPALLVMITWLLLFPIIEGITGRTIGKKLFKLKVIKENFSSASVGTSFVRHLFDVIDVVFLVGLIVATTNARKQRIGDLVAKTFVVESN